MSNRLAIQDPTGIQGEITGYGGTRAWASGNPPVAGPPTNGFPGYAPGCTYQDIINGALYINIGSNTSSLWSKVTTAGSIAADILIAANTGPNDFFIWDGITRYVSIDSRNTVTGVKAVTLRGSPPTIASAAGDTYSQTYVPPITVTLTGVTTVTALDGIGLYIDAPTVTDVSAATVTTISSFYVAAPIAAGSVTGTNLYAINTPGNVNVGGTLTVAGTITGSGSFLVKSPTGGVGYTTGAGGAVTQITSRTTTVTLNTPTGAITLVSAAGSATAFTMSVTNSAVGPNDTVVVSQKSGTDIYSVTVSGIGAGGQFKMTITDLTGTTVEQPVFNFTVIKGAVS